MNGNDHRGARRRIMVVGVGNPDRGDDGIGPLVAKSLAPRLPADVALRVSSGDVLALIDEWEGYDALVCIDAAASMGVAGRIHRIDLGVAPLPRDLAPISSHACGIAEAVALARALDCAPPRIIAYAIEGSCFEAGAGLSPEAVQAAHDVVIRIVDEVAALRQAPLECRGDA
jgi:hydrogenase maturation protease